MYRHLLVPVDGTDLSIEVVGNAVGLAQAVGARITFLYPAAGPDAGELLAKAEAAAHACGVPCSSRRAIDDEPPAAIVEAARGSGCDLIFMALHGRNGGPGPSRASQTLAAVMNDAGLPVLVSAVGDPKPPARAIGILRDEHRSLAAVLHAWMNALATARSSGVAADPALMGAIVRYLRVFSIALHHPKEEQHLFKRLRERTNSVNAELDELERQHLRDRQLVAELAARVAKLAVANGESAASTTRELEDAVRSYAAFVWDHVGREEGVILPAARRHLTEADWLAIDAEFAKNADPLFGSDADAARQLFAHIVGTAQERVASDAA